MKDDRHQFLNYKIPQQNQQILQFSIKDFNWIIQPLEQNKQFGLALGNIKFAQNIKQLYQNKIGAIISVIGENDLLINHSIKHLRILISDSPGQNIKCFFQICIKFIQQNIKHSNILVHCRAGISRSTTIVAAYLMNRNDISNVQALSFIRMKRPNICPNKGFLKQLNQYHKQKKQNKQNKQKNKISDTRTSCLII